MTQIAGRTVLVTGGAGGIGRRMALRFSELGGNLVIWDLNEPALLKTTQEIRAAGGKCSGYRCDVSKRENVYATAERVKAEVGPVHVLVNNAGVVSGMRFLELPDEKIQLSYDVNALALFWTAKAFLPGMIERNEGHIVTISSASGLIGVAKLADYSSSKFAAFGFDECLRVELKRLRSKVRTTVVCPYYINTGMFTGVKTRFPLLLPILEEKDVAEKVVQAVRKNRDRVILPAMVRLIPMLRVFPPVVLDTIAGLMGVNVSMDEFKGRPGA